MANALLDRAPNRPASSAANPSQPSRDILVDLLRAAAVITIVGLHWLMPVVFYDDGVLSTDNALATGAGWAITWAAVAGASILALGVGLASGRINRPAGWARAKRNGRLVA